MDEPRAVSASITISEADQLRSEGTDAYNRSGQTQPDNHPFNLCAAHGYAHCIWCTDGPGIDMPGVGRVPIATVPGSAHVPDQDERERNGLLCRLLFAAHRLAMSRIHAVWPSKRDQCLECGKLANAEDEISHQRLCLAGDVLGLLDQLQGVVPSQNGKEVAENPPEHKVPAVAPESRGAAAGIPVSVIVSVAVLNESRRLLSLWRESIVDSYSVRDEGGIGGIPLTYPDAIRDVMDLDAAIAGIGKVIGGAA